MSNPNGRPRIPAELKPDQVTAIVGAVVKFPDGETKTVIRDTSGVRSGRFTVAFADLITGGEVVSCEVQKRGGTSMYSGYKLAEESPPK